jgi:cytochrome c peroxidase
VLIHHPRVATTIAIMLLGSATIGFAQTPPPPPPPSLKTVVVPEPPNLYDFVADKAAAIRLGKALFWDMQLGSDGLSACASCHFHAGADSRSRNQVNPGLVGRDPPGQPPTPRTFDKGPNVALTATDFPLRVLTDPVDRASVAARDTRNVVGSQGVFNAVFVAVVPGQGEEVVVRAPDPDGFRVGDLNVRRVEPRQTPSVINAVFNHRNFWNGRAQNEFNGVNEWGDRDPAARVFKVMKDDRLAPVQVRLLNASLASQAVAPIVNATEMSATGRNARDIARKLGKKLGHAVPLAGQLVHPQDSVLGPLSRWPQRGLDVGGYDKLIELAFRKEWHKGKDRIRVDGDGNASVVPAGKSDGPDVYTLMEYNFPLFFGLAVQLYEATLVSDDTRYDRWRENRGTLTDQELLGLEVFLGQDPRILPDGTRRAGARCINCHAGPEFTDASVGAIAARGFTRVREGQDLDRGYNNIGVRPALEDLSVGDVDPFGNPLSVTRMLPASGRFVAVDGAFKAPGLRNVELTAPYFHNGGYLTLDGVVEFYSRGGDFAPLLAMDGTPIQPLSVPQMTSDEQAAVVAFLRTLTDDRVRFRRAPFDHPQLFVPNGQIYDEQRVVADPVRPGQAMDWTREIPAVGRLGGPPLPPFPQP